MSLVFISAKSADYDYAQQVYEFLIAGGVPTFFSRESLSRRGDSDYRREIDKALEEAHHMIVVASAVDHIQSPWVEAEWGFFINEKRAGRKTGNLVTISVGSLRPGDLPPSLRHMEVIPFEAQALENLLLYVRPAAGAPPTPGLPVSLEERVRRAIERQGQGEGGMCAEAEESASAAGPPSLGLAERLHRLRVVLNRQIESGHLKAALVAARAILRMDPQDREADEAQSVIERHLDMPGQELIITNSKDGSLLSLIPQGQALVGRRKFPVELPAYYLGVHPVTIEQYVRFLTESGHRSPLGKEGRTPTRSYEDLLVVKSDHPVAGVSWEDAVAYCQWAGLRLPTELEWEKGSAGADGRRYPWGNEWEPDKCRHSANRGDSTTASVWEYPEGCSPWGVYAMAGNVWEWCADSYEGEAYKRYQRGDLSPPANVGGCCVLRGGSWNDDDIRAFLCSFRRYDASNCAFSNYGFRVAKSVTLQ